MSPNRQRSVLAGWIAQLLEEISPAKRHALQKELGLESLEELGNDDRLHTDQMHVLWHRLARESGDRNFGLSFARRADEGRLGLLGYLARNSATVGDAIRRVVRYQRMIKDECEIGLKDLPGGGGLLYDEPSPGEPPWPRHLTESVFAAYVLLPEKWAGLKLRVEAVSFQHPAPADTSAHEEVFGVRPAFGSDHNTMRFPKETLERVLTDGNDQLVRYLEKAADAYLVELPSPDPWVDDARRAIESELPSGQVSVDRVARRMGVSRRTLQRRLGELGLSYQGLLDAVRHQAAENLLALPELNIEHVAEQLGYADASGFRRAYQRWTGMSPREN